MTKTITLTTEQIEIINRALEYLYDAVADDGAEGCDAAMDAIDEVGAVINAEVEPTGVEEARDLDLRSMTLAQVEAALEATGYTDNKFISATFDRMRGGNPVYVCAYDFCGARTACEVVVFSATQADFLQG